MNDKLIKVLVLVAKKKSSTDNFDPESGETPNYYCGNFDDCYMMGCEDGQISMARSLLKEMGIDWSTIVLE